MKSLVSAFMLTLLIPAIAQASLVCDLRDKAVEVVPKTLSEVLECKNQDAIAKDFNSTLDRFNICVQDESFLDPELTCTLISKFVVDRFVSLIPVSWECTAEKFSVSSELLLRKYCTDALKPKK